MSEPRDLTQEELNAKKNEVVKNNENQFLMKFLDAVGNTERFMILEALKKKNCNVTDLGQEIDKSQSTISHHLKILESVGLIKGLKKGKFTQYSLVKENFDKIEELLKKLY